MRKIFKDYSFIGVVLVFSVLFLGILFRVLNISGVSAWGDEVASLYYAQHLDRIFLHESHSPLYYYIGSIWISIFPKSIVSLRYLSIFLSFLMTSLCAGLLWKRRSVAIAFVFLILWWLWPTDISYARQARHYSLYAELTFLLLILWDQRSHFSRRLLLIFCSFFQLVHPFGLIPVWYLAFYDFFKKQSGKRQLFISLGTSIPVGVYYGMRFFLYGREKVFSNISWISFDTFAFQRSLGLLFAGDSFPLTTVFPLPLFWSYFMLLLVVCLFMVRKGFIPFIQKNESLLKFVQLTLLSIIFVELFSYFFSNIRIARYFLYLIPFFLYSLLDWVQEGDIAGNLRRGVLLAGILIAYNLFVLQPWRSYSWDDQNVANFKSYLQLLPPRALVVCANTFQQDYYFGLPSQNCTDEALKLHLNKKNFYLFDLTGNDKLLTIFLVNSGHIDRYQKFNQALFLSVSYP